MKRTFTALALAAVAASAGCSDDPDEPAKAQTPEGESTTLRIRDTSTPGNWSFDKKTLTAKAGTVTIELHNDSGLGHNVRVHTGQCCFKSGFKDLGGTAVIGSTSSDQRDTVKATLDLEPGTYTFLCSIPGHFQAGQHGTLVVD
jgi:plastocyanin